MEYNKYAIGERIRSERIRCGYSNQDALIEDLKNIGVSVGRNTISSLENGEMGKNAPLKLLLGLCDLFDCEIGYLLCEEGYEKCHTRQRADVQAVTGLNENSIEQLEMLQHNSIKMPIAKEMLDTLNIILKDPTCMSDLLESIGGYIGTCAYHDASYNVPGVSDLGLNNETLHFMRIAAACGNLKQISQNDGT